MTDRLKGCWVAFDSDIRTDDAESLINAIRAIRGVAEVESSVANSDDWMARQRVRSELADAMRDTFGRILQVKL